MKNEIIINDKNISRYNKRLQKAISETLGQKIKLSEASELLAKTLGMSSAYELKLLLEKDLTEEFKAKINTSQNVSPMNKIVLIAKQIQKMMQDTKVEFWYAIFTSNGGDGNPCYGTSEYNGLDIFNTYTGFTKFEYDPVPADDYWDSINEELESVCITYGDIDADIESHKNSSELYRESSKDSPEFLIKEKVYNSKLEIKNLRAMLDFAQTMLWETVNYMQTDSDFWLIEKNKITISLGVEKVVIQ